MAAAAPPTTGYRLRCLGPGVIHGPNGQRINLRTRKHAALLYLLARREGRSISRDNLVDLLWADDDVRKARHSVSQSASLTNKAMGTDAIVAAGKDMLLLRDGVLSIDAIEFEAHAAEARNEEAAALWRGELFEGLWLRRAASFERFLAEERLRLGRVLRQVLTDLAESRRRAGNWGAMRAAAEQLMRADPLDEASMLLYLESLILLDDRTLALRRYGEFERRLKDELDAEPSASLRAWVHRHRRPDLVTTRASAVARVSEVQTIPSAQRLFGRDVEFSQTWNGWETAKRSTSRVLVIEGEAGIGKSALVAKVANQAHVMGGSVAYVKCYSTETAVPFAPIAELVRQLSRLPGFISMDPVWIGELTRLVPELRTRFRDVPAPMAIDDSARSRLCDAILHAAEAVASEHPAMIIIDDLHDADEASLALVHYLGRQCRNNAICLIVVVRSCAKGRLPQLTTGNGPDDVQVVGVRPLGVEDTGKVVSHALAKYGREASPADVTRLADASEGIPIRAIEAAIAHALADRRHAVTQVHGFTTSAEDRFNHLTEPARLVAATLAAAGHPLTDYALSVTTDLPLAVLMTATDSLLDASFAVRTGSKLQLVHDDYLRIVRENISAELREKAHRGLASLLGQPGVADPASSVLVAQHLQAAGDHGSAVRQALIAAKFAESLGALREKSLALELAHGISPHDSELAASLCACYLELRDLDRARVIIDRAHTSQMSQSMTAEFHWLSLMVDANDGTATIAQTRDRLESLLVDRVSFPHQWSAHLSLIRYSEKSWAHDKARRAARRLWTLAAADGSAAAMGYRWTAAAYVFAKYRSPRRALDLIERGLGCAQAARDWELELLCRDGLGAIAKMVGQFSASAQHIGTCVSLARKTLNPQAEAMALTNLAVTEAAMGLTDSALAHLHESERLEARFREWPFRAFRLLNRGLLAMELADLTSAKQVLDEAYDFALKQEMKQALHAILGGIGICAVRRLDLDALRRSADRLRGLGNDWHIYADRSMAECALAWDNYLNNGELYAAQAGLRKLTTELRRRDIEHWLTAEMELIRISEHCGGSVLGDERQRVAQHARRYGATLYENMALNELGGSSGLAINA